jgi:hypothetical protein
MRRSILSGDNIEGIGNALLKRLTALGFEVSHCSNTYPTLEAECERIRPDALIFFIYRETDEMYSFVERIVRSCPDTEIFVISYFRSPAVHRKLWEIGACHFVVMPAALGDLSCYIYEVLIPKGDRLFLTEVISFVESKGMQRYTQGFLYLCLAIEVCLEKPELLGDITGGLYPYIAGKMDTSTANVERALRHFSFMASARNVEFDGHAAKQPMKNSELIKAALREFKRKNGNGQDG